MGCDIHAYAERRNGDKWEMVEPANNFGWQSYGVFGFLADVRNYSEVPPIAAPRGFPEDASAPVREEYESWDSDAHSPSWLTVDELGAFDYDRQMEDRRVTRQIAPNLTSGGVTAEPGEGRMTTFREFLGPQFFDVIEKLEAAGAERIVFWFDN